MANFLTYYKKHNPNIYSLLVSLLLALWYNGISGLINYYWPNRGPSMSVIFLMLPLIVFLTDDGHLDELYKAPGIEYPINNSTGIDNNQSSRISAIMAAATPTPNANSIRRERFTGNTK